MDVAFINRSLGMRRGGGEVWDLEMAKALESMGVDVTIYTGKPLRGDTSKPIEIATKTVSSPFLYDLGYAAPIGIGGLISDIDRQCFIQQIERALNDQHDIVHISSHPEFFKIKDRLNIPMTITLHGTPHSLLYDYIHPLKSSESWLEKADAVVSTGTTAEKLKTEYGDVNTVNPGINTDRFLPKGPSQGTEGPVILWVGRFVPAKDLSELVDAFSIVHRDHPNAELWLIGEGGKENEMKSKIEEHELADSTRFLGYVSNEELAPYYRTADIFGFSSKHESFGMVLLEAMACGTPVVAPRIDYIPNIVADETTGLLYNKGDTQDFADQLSRLLADPHLRKLMGEQAATQTHRNHSWDTQAAKLEEIFQSVLANSSGDS